MTEAGLLARARFPPGARFALERGRLSLALLVSRRPWLFIAADALMLLGLALSVVVGGAMPTDTYDACVIIPAFVLGIPLMSDVVAMDRRAGSLDLALSSESGGRAFERRLLAAGSLLLAQSWLVVLIAWWNSQYAFAVVPPLVHAFALVAAVAAISLFWAVRLKTAGAVAVATVGTLLLMGRWSLAGPLTDEVVYTRFLPPAALLLPRFTGSLVLLSGALIAWMHARRRLSRPELLLR